MHIFPYARAVLSAALLMAAMAHDSSGQHAARSPVRVEVNIPAFRLDVWRDSVRVESFGVAVGSRRYATPRGAFAITTVTWNPWWYPPPSEWAANDTVTPPGPANPMGRVKVQLAATYFIHGTPLEASIGSASSHGCLRMRNADAIAFARLLQESAGIAMSDSALERLLASRVTQTIVLPDSVPAELLYRTAEVFGDTLSLHPDVYGLRVDRAAEALAVLERAGIDSASIAAGVLDSLLRRSRTRAVHVALGALRLTPPSVIGAHARAAGQWPGDGAIIARSSGSGVPGTGCVSR